MLNKNFTLQKITTLIKQIISGSILIIAISCTANKTQAAVVDDITFTNSPQITIHDEEVIGDKTIKKDKKKQKKKENTIYDLYSEQEREILFRIVEAEIGIGKTENKMNIANVIINRVKSDLFPNTIKEVVFEKVCGTYQFSPISDKRYWSVEVSDDTIKACEKIFFEPDTTNGCLFFDSCSSSWASRNREFAFNDGYHRFFY